MDWEPRFEYGDVGGGGEGKRRGEDDNANVVYIG